MIKLSHHDDGKQKWHSHTIGILDDPRFYNADYDVVSHNFFDVYGSGETKEEALKDFKKKFDYLLKEWIAFGYMMRETEVIDSDIVEVDCFGREI